MVNVARTIKNIAGIFRDFIASEEFSYKNGYLQNVRADVKLVGIFMIIFLAITTNNLFFFACLIASAFFMALISKIRMKEYASRFYFIPFFSLIVVLPWIVLKEGKPIYSFHGINFTYEGAIYVGTFFMRVVACVAILSLLLFTTKTSDLIYSLRKMRVPSTMVDIFVIIYRYTFTFLKELYSMLLGKESRTFVRKNSIKDAKIFIGNFMQRVLTKNENIYMAMKSKGFNGSFKVYKKECGWNVHTISYIAFIFTMVCIWMMIRL